MTKEWLFKPADTLFFRNGLPFGEGHSVYIKSIFPPTPESMQGIVRSSVLHTECTSPALMECHLCKSRCNIPAHIGDSSSNMGKLKLSGPYLIKDKQRYFPIPSDIMTMTKRIFVLRPSKKPVECDIGLIHLPDKPADCEHFEPVGGWISVSGMQRYLEGDVPDDSHFLCNNQIFKNDYKVGIKRENETHTAEEGNLYSISLIRLKEDISIAVFVDGIPDNLEPPSPFLTKFGGEGKICKVEINNGITPLVAKDMNLSVKKDELVKLVLLSPAYFGGTWYPEGFTKKQINGATCWEGNISGTKMRLISACIDKPYKIGGWDLKEGKSKPIRSFIPSGSVFYLNALENNTIPTEGKIGNMQQTGFGHYVIGRWKDV